jgi:hypothetical protein
VKQKTHPLTAEQAKLKAPKRGAWKAIRAQRRKAYYGSVPLLTIANKRRTLARQLRNHPDDSGAVSLYTRRYGDGAAQAQLAKLTSKGTKRHAKHAANIRSH